MTIPTTKTIQGCKTIALLMRDAIGAYFANACSTGSIGSLSGTNSDVYVLDSDASSDWLCTHARDNQKRFLFARPFPERYRQNRQSVNKK